MNIVETWPIVLTLSSRHTVRGRKNQSSPRTLMLSIRKITRFFSQLTHPVARRADHVEGLGVALESASALVSFPLWGRALTEACVKSGTPRWAVLTVRCGHLAACGRGGAVVTADSALG